MRSLGASRRRRRLRDRTALGRRGAADRPRCDGRAAGQECARFLEDLKLQPGGASGLEFVVRLQPLTTAIV